VVKTSDFKAYRVRKKAGVEGRLEQFRGHGFFVDEGAEPSRVARFA
jgi:hypothetical protein